MKVKVKVKVKPLKNTPQILIKMVANQCCKKCRCKFDVTADERNYKLYANYGFLTEERFRKHNGGNKKCPCKSISNISPVENNSIYENYELPIWGVYIQNTSLISEGDYVLYQGISQLLLKIHKNGGRPLWFHTTEQAGYTILQEGIMNRLIQWITLVAEPGSGKTMVLHLLIHIISLLPHELSINYNSITLTTGMSDIEWYSQVLNNFQLKDGKYLWEGVNKLSENNCIVHRSNFHKRITYLLNNPQYISNHIFIIDESHFADDPDMTIDKEFKRLGLTEERMIEYNIKVIFVSATPDVQLSLMSSKDNHRLVWLENGEGYKGFRYYIENNMIHNYVDGLDIGNLIRSKWSNPRFHYIRARTNQEKGEYRSQLVSLCEVNGWIIFEDDSENDVYLSFKSDEPERVAAQEGRIVVKAYEPPITHTFILIKNKYSASKRLKLTPYTGLISEKPAKKMNTSVTCNGLIPRFFGYDELPIFSGDEKPLFMCNKDSVHQYIRFSEDFIYEGKNYTSARLNVTPDKIKELKNTWSGEMGNITPKTHDSKIGISEPYDSTDDIGRFLREDCGFEEHGIGVQDLDALFPERNGYIYPKRSIPGHTSSEVTDTFLTKNEYINKFVDKAPGTSINRQGLSASGQCFMVWPVYETHESLPEDVKYYVHYLILN